MVSFWTQLVATAALVALTAGCSQAPSNQGDSGLAAPPRPGDAAPGFSLPTADGEMLALTEFRGRSPVLLYFSMGPG